MPTRREIAARANAVSVQAARRRRFNSAVMEMAEHPGDLSGAAAEALADLLRLKGWRVDSGAAVTRP